MNKEFEAYYAKHVAWIFLIAALIPLTIAVILWKFSLDSCIGIVACLLTMGAMVYAFIVNIKKNGIAVEVADNVLILHKKEPVIIPIFDISKVSISDGGGSFDLSVRTCSDKYSMHCFIKQERKKKKEFVRLMESKGVKVNTFDNSAV